MNFLTPLFLLGALAIAAPVIFHLIRRTTKLRTVFGSLMFLRPTPPRLTKRNRIEDLLLLLLRCAVLGLLAAAFARPFFKQPIPDTAVPGAAKHIVVLVDTSASMRRGSLWTDARNRAEEVFRKAAPVDHVALFTFDRQLNPLVSFEQWDTTAAGDRVAFAQARLAGASPGWSGTLLDQALIRAGDTLADNAETNVVGPRQIVVISDLQTGSHLSGLQAYDWPKGVEVTVERLTPRPTSNAGLQLLADARDTAPAAAATIRVRVSNEPDSKREQFQVGWAREGGVFVTNATDIYVPSGQSRVVALPAPPANSGADRIVLRGDDEDFDNVVFAMPPETAQNVVAYFGSDAETETRQPLYFVNRAFQETLRQSVRVVPVKGAGSLHPADAEAATLLIATEALTEARARELRELVNAGKTLLFAPATAAAAATLGTLLGTAPLTVEEAAVGEYALLGDIDFRHPLFAPFADPRFSDFTKIHFWKHRKLDAAAIPGARVPARFDNGTPAIIEVPLGRGRVVVFTSGWPPADSQLALSSKFVPLLYSLLELSGSTASAPAQFHVGDTIPLPAELARTNGFTVTGPDNAPLTIVAGQTNFTRALTPGIYRMNTQPIARRFAVNLDAAESRTAPLPLDALDRLGAPSAQLAAAPASQSEQRKLQLHSAELESQQKLWRWILLAALGVVLVETGLAGWSARRQTTLEGTNV